MSEILVIGSLNIDMTQYVDEFPKVGETISSSGFAMVPGGKGSNQALAAARLGASVSMAGRIGNDTYGDITLEDLNESHVDTSLIQRDSEVYTGLASITVAGGSNTIIVYPGANGRITPEDIDRMEDRIAAARILIVQFEIPMETVERAVQLAHRHGCTVIINPAPYKEIPASLLPLADYLIPNESEAASLLGWDEITTENAADALAEIRKKGVRTPIITMGKNGAAYLDGDTLYTEGCVRVNAIDTTAAGDTFIGALAYGLVRGKTLKESIRLAQHASAICVTRKGAHTAIPTMSDIKETFGEI